MDADLAPGTPDPTALRRRVLLTALVTLLLFLTTAYVLTALELSSWWLLPVMAVVWALVVRPLMRPVHEAVALRRRLAFQAYLDQREGLDQRDSLDQREEQP